MKKLYTNRWWVVVALAAGSGCAVGASASSSSIGPRSGQTSGHGTHDSGASASASSCETPADHCLQPDDLLVSEGFKSGHAAAQLGKQTAPPNSAGEATYMILGDGSTKTSRVAYRSHRATTPEIMVGALVVMLDATDSANIYRVPASREEAMTLPWFVARIVSIDPAPQGHVIVSGGYNVALDALRIVDGDDHPRLTAPGAEDAMFLKPEHWLVGTDALPTQGYINVRSALAIQPPSPKTRNEGEFLITQTGERSWLRHAWRTRPATPADVKLGAYVMALDVTDSAGVYRAPESRLEALGAQWFIAKVTDTRDAFKGVVTVSGGYRVAVQGLRVPLK
ncbi:MAG: hypothetical protein ACTHU0_35095 [Kofleriaceae bacterium]